MYKRQAQTGLLDLGIQQVIEPGGPIAISDGVNSSLESQGIDVIRLAGQDASDTSTQIARFELGGQPNAAAPLGGPAPAGTPLNFGGAHPSGLGWTRSSDCQNRETHGTCEFTAALARGDFFADALTSSVVTGNTGYPAAGHLGPEPVLLTEDPNTLGTALTTFFNEAGSPYGINPVLGTALTPQAGTGDLVETIQPFGGPIALADATIQAALNAIAAGA